MIETQGTVVDWLLESDEPGVVFQTKRDLLGETEPPSNSLLLGSLE